MIRILHLSLGIIFATVSLAAAETPHWIWAQADRAEAREIVFVSSVDTTTASSSSIGGAAIRGGADFCHLRIAINGREIAIVDAYADWFNIDVSQWMKRGENHIELRANAVEGPSAVAVRIEVQLADGKQVSLDTNPQDWTTKSNGDAEIVSHGQVRPEMWIPERPARIQPFDDYTQWKRALDGEGDVASFETPEGYSVRRVLRAGPEQSSWVSMGVQRQGIAKGATPAVLIGREDQGLLRAEWSQGGTSDAAATPEVENVPGTESLKEIRGITQATDGHWIVNANNSKAVYQLFPQASPAAWRVQQWREFPGGVGHGRNDLFWTLSPDVFRIGDQYRSRPAVPTVYSIHGDSVDVPKGDDVQDWTSPLRNRASQREGHLLRMRIGEKQQPVAIVCGGLRNPFGVAMNLDGERFTYDADAEFDMGAPWYRPTRIVHLVSGADYGWRGVTGSWPPYFPDHADNALPLCDVGKGSPTAVAFGYAGNFPDADRNALFVLDWAYGRVLQVNLTPRGAGYRARVATFLRGRPLNVTDIDFLNGDMLLVTGGRKTQSNLYRVSYDGDLKAKADTETKSSQEIRRGAFGARQRLARQQLEQSHRSQSELPKAQAEQWIKVQIWPYLADPDPMIRYAARVALERQPIAAWKTLALNVDSPVTAITALTALAAAPDAPREAILKRLNWLPWETLEPAEQARLVRCDAMCLQGDGIATETRQACQQRHLSMHRASAETEHCLPTGLGLNVVQATLQLLLEQQVSEATPLAARLLSQAETQRDELFYLFILRDVKSGWTLQSRRQFFTAMQNTKDYLAGDGMPGFIRQIHEQAVKTLSNDEQKQLGELTSLEQEAAPLPPPRPLVKKRELKELLAELKASDVQGDAGRGELLFQQGLCARCHRKDQVGRLIGPSLTNVGSRFRHEDLLKSIIEPSAVVAEKYQQAEIVTEDGRRITGRATWGGDYRSPTLQVVTDPLRPAEVTDVPKSEIAQRRQSKVSPMPTGLLDTLTIQEIQDLLAFLLK